MSGLTTVAGVPSGSGQAANPKPEVAEQRKPEPPVPMADYFKSLVEEEMVYPYIGMFEPFNYAERS